MITQLTSIEHPVPLWPGVPNEIASQYGKYVATLTGRMEEMVCNRYPTHFHRDCGFVETLEIGIQKILAEMPSGMLESHRQHMATQRIKLGQSHALLGQLGRPRQPFACER